jgi:hypothetical protein
MKYSPIYNIQSQQKKLMWEMKIGVKNSKKEILMIE